MRRQLHRKQGRPAHRDLQVSYLHPQHVLPTPWLTRKRGVPLNAQSVKIYTNGETQQFQFYYDHPSHTCNDEAKDWAGPLGQQGGYCQDLVGFHGKEEYFIKRIHK